VFKPNYLILKLISSDFFLYAGWGLISPVFAIFMTEQIKGGTLETVGLAVALYWIVKSTLQPFFAHHMDKVKGEKDDLSYLKKGMIITTAIPLLYIFAFNVWHVFLLEIFRGVGMAMVVPAWFGMFTRHIDRNWEAYTWSLQSTALGYAFGVAAVLGGVMAAFIGFRAIFFLVFLLNAFSTLLLYYIREDSIIAPEDVD